jgi:hypothetical protein
MTTGLQSRICAMQGVVHEGRWPDWAAIVEDWDYSLRLDCQCRLKGRQWGKAVIHVVNALKECRLQNWNGRFLFAMEMPVDTGSSGQKVENPMVQTQEPQLQQSMWQWLPGLDLVVPSVTPTTFSTNLCSDPSNLGSHSTSHTLDAS